MTPYISGFASVPKSLLSPGQIAKLKKLATVTPRVFQPGEIKEPLEGFRETNHYLHLPVEEGVLWLKKAGLELVFKDQTSLGHPITCPTKPDPDHPEAGPGQAEFMEKVFHALTTRYACLGVAGTGNGKTAVACWEIATLGRTALVVVPGENLAANWKDEVMKHLGLTEDEIGWVQQDKCDYIGKKVVLAVVHSLCKRGYPPGFYSYFGTVVYDEVHGMAAKTFSRALGKVNARYKLALSATPERPDGCIDLVLNYFGKSLVTSDDDEPLECDAIVVNYNLPFDRDKLPPHTSILINMITKLKSRNQLVVNWIGKLRKKKRVILVLSDRIEQLDLLMNWTHEQHGIPFEHMCIYAKQRIVNGQRVKVGLKELQVHKKNPNILIYFATYGVFKQGENIPRLDAGIEASPPGNGKQPPGRVRRRRKGKPKPIWVSIRDKGSNELERRTKAREHGFKSAKIKICQG